MDKRAKYGAERATQSVITDRGWRAGTSLENRVAWYLHRYGQRPGWVDQQHRVGSYRLDFAWPEIKVALEADGWHHQSPHGAAKDAERDSYLRAQGWLVFRVDDQHGEDAFAESIARVCAVVSALDEPGWRKRRWKAAP